MIGAITTSLEKKAKVIANDRADDLAELVEILRFAESLDYNALLAGLTTAFEVGVVAGMLEVARPEYIPKEAAE